MRSISLPEFAGRMRMRLAENKEPVVWFLGAGCSVTSGIPGAAGLVDIWLKKLYAIQGGGLPALTSWAAARFKTYDANLPGRAYAEVFGDLYFNPADRQQEIERICASGEAGYGYATFAQIITDPQIGHLCNTVLTTNFDDLITEAIYLYGALGVRPQVINHEALAGYARFSSRRPTIVKLHGDAHVDPKNLGDETKSIDPVVAGHLYPLIQDRAIVFIGYGGNDESINGFLRACPSGAHAPPIYWVGRDEPSPDMKAWLAERQAVLVDHVDFDRAMHLLRAALNIDHPPKERWARVERRYYQAALDFDTEIKAEPNTALKSALEQASTDAAASLPDEWAYVRRALALEAKDPDAAMAVYREGCEKFPASAPLLGNYANFLKNSRKDMDGAETYYQRALEADPNHAGGLGNYALFLEDIRKDMDGAETYYQRALAADPNHANNLGNYANFLKDSRKDMDGAETYYQRALEADPNHAINLGNYAQLLFTLGRKPMALDMLDKADKACADADAPDPVKVELAFYSYAHDDRVAQAAPLAALKQLILGGARSAGWDLSANVERAIADRHPNPDLLRDLAKVISEDAPVSILEAHADWRDA